MAVRVFRKLFWREKQKIFVIPKRYQSITGNKKADDALLAMTGGRIQGWLEYLNQMSGQVDVRRAQDKVLEAEKIFQAAQKERRLQSRKLTDLEVLIHQSNNKKEMATRGTEEYLVLVTKENELFSSQNDLKARLQVLEEEERDSFSKMSSSLRASQEIERVQARRSQMFGYFLSIAGAVVGAILSLIISERRMSKLHAIVSTSTDMVDGYKTLMAELREHLQQQQSKMTQLMGLQHRMRGENEEAAQLTGDEEAQNLHQQQNSTDQCLQEILQSVKNQEALLDKEISSLKKIYGSESAQQSSDSVVYVGPEIKDILNDTEKYLEWKMKMTALASATFVYGAVVLTLPIIYIFVKGTGGA